MRQLACVALLLAQANVAQAAALLQDKTVILLCQETVDAAGAQLCTLEASLLEWLRGEGARTMDAAQTDRIRRQMSPEKWTNPTDLKGVDVMDADYAVVVITRGSAQMNVGKMKSYLVQVAVRVVDVSRGNVVHQADLTGNGLGLNANAAMVQGCTALWTQKSPQFRAGLEVALHAPVFQDVWVYDVPDLDAVTRVEERLKQAPNVGGVRRTAFTRGVGRWQLQLKDGGDPALLARALEEGESPLFTQGLTGGVLQVAYRPLGRMKLPVRVTAKAARGVPAWFVRAAADLAVQQVRSTGWMVVVDASSKERAVDVTVDVGPGGNGFVVKANARAGKTQMGVAVEKGKEDVLPELLQRALDKVLADVRTGLERNPGEYAAVTRALTASLPLTARLNLDGSALRVVEAQRWATQGVGSVTLSGAAEDVVVRVRLGDGTWQASAGVQQGQDVRVTLPEVETSWRTLARTTSTTLQVEVVARTQERLHRFVLSKPVVVYPVRAMAWSHPESYAAFIHPAAPWARALAQQHAASEATPTPTTARLAAVWDALQRQGLRYVPDPTSPFGAADLDLVQFPTETLATGGGDCDDLVALVATAFEAAGAPTVVLKLPRHVIVAVGTALPFSAWPLFVARADQALSHAGRLYLPVETTAVGGSFWDAVERGGARLSSERSAVQVLDPRPVWATVAPLEQPGTVAWTRSNGQPRVRVMVMTFTAGRAWEAAARLATRAVAAELANNPALEVVTEEQVQDLANLQRAQMLSGCEGVECVSDIGRAMAVRAVWSGRVDVLGDKPLLHMSIQDVAGMTSEAAASVALTSNEFNAGAVTAPVAGMARAYLARRAPGVVAPSTFAAHAARLEKQVAGDAYAKARFLAFQGRLEDARAVLPSIKQADRRALAMGNLALLDGRPQDARTAFGALDSEQARLNLAFTACASAAPGCAQAASGLSAVRVAALTGVDVDGAAVAVAGGDGPEATVDDVVRAVMDAAQGKPPRQGAATTHAAVASRWLLQW